MEAKIQRSADDGDRPAGETVVEQHRTRCQEEARHHPHRRGDHPSQPSTHPISHSRESCNIPHSTDLSVSQWYIIHFSSFLPPPPLFFLPPFLCLLPFVSSRVEFFMTSVFSYLTHPLHLDLHFLRSFLATLLGFTTPNRFFRLLAIRYRTPETKSGQIRPRSFSTFHSPFSLRSCLSLLPVSNIPLDA